MHYHLFSKNPDGHFIDIECRIPQNNPAFVVLKLPAWRPGRYELQNFAKNIQKLAVFNDQGAVLVCQKITKDSWLITGDISSEITVRYNYYADLQNAGSSYVDSHLWYVNPVNLCVYTDEELNNPCTLQLDIPAHYLVACGLQKKGNLLLANDYYELVDSPIIASATLQHQPYEVAESIFHVWIQGNLKPDWARILADFRAFTVEQVATMGGTFPEKEYHFLNLILPTPLYHGVEHRHSTMIVLGPDDEGEGLYTDLLGVSSHELFHAWNVIKIRPKELLPYDFTKENYFPTCFVVEGATTYYGDLFLRRSGVFDDDAYLRELQTYLKRHFENARHASQSLVESSFDLWLDGYEKSIPDRKVSVYQKGALVTLILDLTIRKISQHQRSFDDVMRALWQKFGIPFVGYTLNDYKTVVENVVGEPLNWYWELCIEGNGPLENRLNENLAWVGLQMTTFSDGTVQLQELDDPRGFLQRQQWLKSVL